MKRLSNNANDTDMDTSSDPFADKIKFKLVASNFLTRWPCHVCGGSTEKEPILAESDDGFRVCERCLELRDFDAALQARAIRLEREAAETRDMVGRIEAPTYAEWQLAMKQHESDFCDEFDDPPPTISGVTLPARLNGYNSQAADIDDLKAHLAQSPDPALEGVAADVERRIAAQSARFKCDCRKWSLQHFAKDHEEPTDDFDDNNPF
jgi:hypothetical protein